MSSGFSDSNSSSSKSSSDEAGYSESESEEDTPTSKNVSIRADGTSVPGVCPPAEYSSQALRTIKTVQKQAQRINEQRRVKAANMNHAPVNNHCSQESDGLSVAAKRQKTDAFGSSVTTFVVQQPKASNPRQKGDVKGQPPKTRVPFSRIKVDEIKFADERLKHNTFESRKASTNDYGAKANADLIITRGVGFRKEKNKKKRGSYRGGEITVSVLNHLEMCHF